MTRLLYILIFSTLLFSRSVSVEAEIQYVIKPQFEDAKSFEDGLALVAIGRRGGQVGIYQQGRRICYQSAI